MNWEISGLTRREVLFTKSEAKLIQDLLNNLHWENCKEHPRLMRTAMTALNKLDTLTYQRPTANDGQGEGVRE